MLIIIESYRVVCAGRFSIHISVALALRGGRVAPRAGLRGVLRLRGAAPVGAAGRVPHQESASLDAPGL